MISENEIPEKMIIETIKEYLNTYVYLDIPILLERYSTTFPSLCIRQVDEIEKKNCNILGEYTGKMTFALCVRISKEDDPIIAYQLLDKLSSFINTANTNYLYPDFGADIQCQRIVLSSNSALEKINQDYSEDYKVIFTVIFHKKQNIYR